MALIKCPDCGKEISDDSKFCSNCGKRFEENFKKEQAPVSEEVTFQQNAVSKETENSNDKGDKEVKDVNVVEQIKDDEDAKVEGDAKDPKQVSNKKPNSIFSQWYFWVIIGLIVVVIVVSSVCIVSVISSNSGSSSTGVQSVFNEKENVEMPDNKGRTLSGGTYTIGQDLPAGKYALIYKTTLDEKTYWANDYFYIIRNGSDGQNETMGGTKYDERIGNVVYKEAVNGKSFFLSLKSGDKITVNSKFGTWTY